MTGRTAVLISHRVAAIKDADQIVVLDQGKVVERGTHDELIDKGGVYSDLYRTQLESQLEIVQEAS
jgi:ATP-binding cassette subfamily B protein